MRNCVKKIFFKHEFSEGENGMIAGYNACYRLSDRKTVVIVVLFSLIGSFALAQGPQDLPTPTSTTKPQTSWPSFGFVPAGGRYNTKETILSPSNVRTLILQNKLNAGASIQASPAIFSNDAFFGTAAGWFYDVSPSKKLWSYDIGAKIDIYSTAAISRGVVYFGAGNAALYAFTTAGVRKWTFMAGSLIDSSPVVSGGNVYFASFDGYVYAVNASTGALVWKYFTDAPVMASPSVSNGNVYIASSNGSLFALNANTGALVWSYFFGTGLTGLSTPAIVNGTLYIGELDGNLYAFNATTGVVLGTFKTGEPIQSSPAVAKGAVYICSDDGNVYSVNPTTMKKNWSFDIGAERSSPAVANGVVYVAGDTSNSVYAFNASTGAKLWSYATRDNILGSVVVVNGRVVITSTDGFIYFFHLR